MTHSEGENDFFCLPMANGETEDGLMSSTIQPWLQTEEWDLEHFGIEDLTPELHPWLFLSTSAHGFVLRMTDGWRCHPLHRGFDIFWGRENLKISNSFTRGIQEGILLMVVGWDFGDDRKNENL